MSESPPLARLSLVQLERLIRGRAETSRRVVFTRHVEIRMKQRHILRAEVI